MGAKLAFSPRGEGATSRHRCELGERRTIILRADEENTPGAAEALETFARTYWPPIYRYIRRKGHNDFNVAEVASIPANPNPPGPFVQLELVGANYPKVYIVPWH
jgi:hypothetical protein